VPIALGITALFGRSLFEILTGTGSGYMDSFTGLVFFLLIGRVVQQRTFASLSFDRDYRSYFPLAVTVKDAAGARTLPVASLEVGQTIWVRNGELVPADSRLLSAACQADYSYVTGESEPVDRKQGDTLYAGGRVVGPAVEMVVLREVSQSRLTRLWNHAAFRKERGEELNLMVNAVSRHFTAAVLAIAALAGLFWLRADPGLAASAFTSVLIIACPCALSLSTPFTMGTAVNLLGRAGLYLKNTGVVERLARIDAIVFDKTGTLTSAQRMEVEFVGAPLAPAEAALLAGALRNSLHPLSRRLLEALPGDGEGPGVTNYREEPGKGLRCAVDGRELVVGSRAWLVEGGLPEDELPPAPAGTAVFVAIGSRFRGYYRLVGAYRKHIDHLFAALRGRFRLFLLSGDNDRERGRLQPFFGDAGRLRFDQSPADKLEFVRRLQEEGSRALVVGDGLNDAGALRHGEVGIAVAEGAFSPACDGILDADRLAALPAFLRFARACRGVVVASFVLSFLYNVVGLSFAVRGSLSPLLSAVLMPLSSVSVIAFTTAATRLLAGRAGVGR
jgi:Cu+-exporting ATPase